MRYLAQVHLTENCNLRCKHCYQSERMTDVMSLGQLNELMRQLEEFRHKGFDTLKVNLTGGEPLVLSDIRKYIDVVLEVADKVVLLTNGTLVDNGLASFLASRNVHVQVSIDGVEDTHDKIRGCGSYAKAISGIRTMVENGVFVIVGCTLHKDNFNEVREIVKLMKDEGVRSVWFDRYIPCGNAEPLSSQEFMVAMTQLADARRYENATFRVGSARALQFLYYDCSPYRCTALSSSMTILPNGTVYPCRRMPIKIGNCFEMSLGEIYDTHPMRTVLGKIPEQCQGCAFKNKCRGGLKCLTYAVRGTVDEADPDCFIKED